MYIPQEIQDYIIDIIAQSVPTKPKKDLSNLRFVCRAWIARVDFHLFRDLRMEAAQGPKLLSMVKSSKFSIGLRVRKLSIYGGASLSNRTLFPYYDNEVALQEYAKEFVESLPFLESLELLSLYPDQISWVPCFPTIKSLALPNVSVWPSLILRLISAARSLETLICDDCDVYEEGNIDFGTLPALLQDSICFKTLKAYEALIGWYNDITYLTSYLFPSHLEPDLPSLTSLSLKGVHSGTIRIAMHLLKAVSRSLRFLQLWFGRGDDENDGELYQSMRTTATNFRIQSSTHKSLIFPPFNGWNSFDF